MEREAVDEVLADGEERPTVWAFMKARDIGDGQTVYLRRIYLIATPWFSILLHRIYRPDKQRDLHDHPWNFLSLILRGEYTETIGDAWRQCMVARRWFNWKRAEDRHSITHTSRSPVWTLVFTGRRRRKWGFWVRMPHDTGTPHYECPEKFIPFDQYEKLNQP